MPGQTQIRFRNVPEFGGPFYGPNVNSGTLGSVPFFADTGLFSANSVNLLNGELAGVWNSFHAQSELTYAVVNPVGGGTTTFSAFSAQAAYLLTGEVRPYNKVAGVLGRITPTHAVGNGGIGAWEVAARYSYLDLTDGTFNGGMLSDVTLGLNWYLNGFTKFQLNYIRAMLNRPPVGDSTTNILAVRAQLDF
jgi:phosphate-selective porin OprO/OprP